MRKSSLLDLLAQIKCEKVHLPEGGKKSRLLKIFTPKEKLVKRKRARKDNSRCFMIYGDCNTLCFLEGRHRVFVDLYPCLCKQESSWKEGFCWLCLVLNSYVQGNLLFVPLQDQTRSMSDYQLLLSLLIAVIINF